MGRQKIRVIVLYSSHPKGQGMRAFLFVLIKQIEDFDLITENFGNTFEKLAGTEKRQRTKQRTEEGSKAAKHQARNRENKHKDAAQPAEEGPTAHFRLRWGAEAVQGFWVRGTD